MESKSILVGIIIGVIVGIYLGVLKNPSPDVSGLELEQLQQKVSTLQDEKNTLEASLQTKNTEISALKDQIDQLEAQIRVLEAQVTDLSSQVNLTYVTASFSRPEDTSSQLQYWIRRTNETIRLMVMLITQDMLADALIEAYNRGIDIDIIIDDGWLYSTGSDYQEILDVGIDIKGDNRGGLMHHKVMIIDGYIVVTGSYNWSAAAEDSNDENIIILKSRVIAQKYMEEFDRLWLQT